MSLFFIVILCAVAVVLFYYAFAGFFSSKSKKKKNKKPQPAADSLDGILSGCCPLCKTPLTGSSKMISVIFQGGDPADRLCHIKGCTFCLEDPTLKRICPVCRKQVPITGYLISHLFLRKGNKHHVHIVGCTECHKK